MKNFIIICIVAVGIFLFFGQSKSLKKNSNRRDGLGLKIEIISYNGEDVYLKSNTVKGGITVFDFYADWCGPCKQLASDLEPYVRRTPGVYLRKINIKDWQSPVARNYQIKSIPSVWIYDQNGNEVKTKLNSFSEIKKIVDKL